MADPNFPTGGEAKQQLLAAQHAENRVAAIMLESGVIFHSIFIGIDLGINPDPGVVRPLMIALMFHQVRKFVWADFLLPAYCSLVVPTPQMPSFRNI